MGKKPLVRILNRGVFPRWRLESVGSSSKRDKMADTSQGGWFGSGTKIAPVAALALGMDVWVTSHDSEGSYLVSYDVVRRDRDGESDTRVVRVYHGATVYRQVTDFSPDAFMNWSKPIGDDDKKEFRVWREYFRNGYDADVRMHIAEVPSVQRAAPGMTAVFLTKTAEFDAIMRNVNRYFKYLSKDKAFFVVPGVGEFWPKSQEGVTRLFSLGTLAFCNDNTRTNWSALYDYSFDNKELMSEERTFENMNKVYLELARMLAAVASVQLAKALLEAMLAGKAELERVSLGQVGAKFPIPGKERWKAAWHAIYGDDAVIASGNWADQHVRFSYSKNPIHVVSHGLKKFLRQCGVQESGDVLPAADRQGFKLVEPTLKERGVLEEAKEILYRRHPEMMSVPIHVYEALDEQSEKFARGFCLPPVPPFTDVYVRRAELAHLRLVLGTLNHEFRHVRTGAYDGTPEFMDRADEDEVALLIELRRLEEEDSWELEWDDLKTDPGTEPAPLIPPPPPPKKT